MFVLKDFINRYVTKRADSMFKEDIECHAPELKKSIDNKTVLVIGGAGSIGSNFIKALLKHGTPKSLVVVDYNENGLAELTRDLRKCLEVGEGSKL